MDERPFWEDPARYVILTEACEDAYGLWEPIGELSHEYPERTVEQLRDLVTVTLLEFLDKGWVELVWETTRSTDRTENGRRWVESSYESVPISATKLLLADDMNWERPASLYSRHLRFGCTPLGREEWLKGPGPYMGPSRVPLSP